MATIVTLCLPPCSGLIPSWKWSDCLETPGTVSLPKTMHVLLRAGPTHFLPHSCLTAWLPTTSVNTQVAPASGSLYLVCPLPRGSSPAHSLGQPPLKATCSDHFFFSPLHSVEAISFRGNSCTSPSYSGPIDAVSPCLSPHPSSD